MSLNYNFKPWEKKKDSICICYFSKRSGRDERRDTYRYSQGRKHPVKPKKSSAGPVSWGSYESLPAPSTNFPVHLRLATDIPSRLKMEWRFYKRKFKIKYRKTNHSQDSTRRLRTRGKRSQQALLALIVLCAVFFLVHSSEDPSHPETGRCVWCQILLYINCRF